MRTLMPGLVVGLLLTGFGYMDSCPGDPAPGWSCYSPPWAVPAYDLGRVIVVLAVVMFIACLLGYRRSTGESRFTPDGHSPKQ
jgi:hypothetical protein